MERQYIGARYVPMFADPIEWNSGMTYEPLTIVTYLGASYTSKKAVPAGIIPTNSSYWAVTGNYNAQVEEYRQQVVATNQKIEELENSLSNYERSRLEGKRILVLGDSTSDETTGYPNWVHHLRNKMESIGGTVTNIAVNGVGVAQQLASLKATSTADIDIIVLLLGINNMNLDYGQSRNDINEMCIYLHGLNKETHWVTPTTTNEVTHASSAVLQSSLSDYIANACKLYGINVIDGAALPMLSPSNPVYMPDSIHPSANYAKIMCDYIFECVAHYSGGYFTKNAPFYRIDNEVICKKIGDVELECDYTLGYYQEFAGMTFVNLLIGGLHVGNDMDHFTVYFNNNYLARIVGYSTFPMVTAHAYSNNTGRIKIYNLSALQTSANFNPENAYLAYVNLWPHEAFEADEILAQVNIQILLPVNTPLYEQKPDV